MVKNFIGFRGHKIRKMKENEWENHNELVQQNSHEVITMEVSFEEYIQIGFQIFAF